MNKPCGEDCRSGFWLHASYKIIPPVFSVNKSLISTCQQMKADKDFGIESVREQVVLRCVSLALTA